MRDAPARPPRGLDPISAMSWGVEPVRRDQQGKSTIRMRGVYAVAPDKASEIGGPTRVDEISETKRLLINQAG
jgi:hypothetical protein